MKAIMPTEEEVRFYLRNVMDPEVGMNIVDLGLVYGVTIADNKLQIDLTMTTPACPMSEMIIEDAQYALKELVPDGAEIDIKLVWEPKWTPAMMTENARQHFGWDESSNQAD